MEKTWQIPALLTFLLLALAAKFLSLQRKTRRRNLPPFPARSLPLVGHLHLLKPPLHRTLRALAERAGPVFSLDLGDHPALVVSSAAAVEECFGKNDVVLANRHNMPSSKLLTYDHTTVVGSSYGDYWRGLRRLTALEIFSTTRLNSFLGIRKDEIRLMTRELCDKNNVVAAAFASGESASSGGGFARVNFGTLFSKLTFNIIMRMVAGKKYYSEDTAEYKEASVFRRIVRELTQSAGGLSNPADFVSVLRWIDYGGRTKKIEKISQIMDKYMQGLIDEHRKEDSCLESRDTLIDHMLSLQKSEQQYYTDKIIKGVLQVMLVAGTDTSALTLEWAMALLLNHPEILQKVKDEVDTHVGRDRLIDEADLSKLNLLQGVVLETLRLHPPAPLLLPHKSSEDCTIGGYDVPRGTILVVNAWAIHRDPKLWEDPESFKPERFQSGEAFGQKFLPFGLGRRSCPGAGLAQKVIALTLGSLVQCFEWKRITEKPIDLTEGLGSTVPLAGPLEAQCRARPILSEVLAMP